MTDERDEQEEMDSLNELGDEELEPILSEGEETDPNEGDEKASEDFDEPDEENPWEYSTRFAGLSDEEIVSQAQQHDDAAVEYLLYKYKNFVRSKARSYFLIGADHEDIVQEGMIGLYKAIRDYQPERLSSFRAFAELCITRQIITAIKTATRQKHIPLNSYISLNKPVFDEESERTLGEVVTTDKASNPEDLFINQENLLDIESTMHRILSPLEQEVVMLYLDGKSYVEIAQQLNRHVKSVDNALQRVKRKLEQYLEKREERAK